MNSKAILPMLTLFLHFWTVACQLLTHTRLQIARLRDCIKSLEIRCSVLDAKRQVAEQQQLAETNSLNIDL